MSAVNDPFMSMICAVNTDLGGGVDEMPLCSGSDEDPLQCPGFDNILQGLCPGLSPR